MFDVKTGNIFDSECQTLTNTVNCVGIMGKGIALGFKKQFPAMFEEYARLCKAGKVKLGQPLLYKATTYPWILNFPTKNHWRSVSRVKDIVEGLEFLLANYKRWGITSLAVPPLGCGNGELEWRVVGRTLYRYLSQMEIPVELYAPWGTPVSELGTDFLADWSSASPERVEKINPGALALVEILHRLEEQPFSPFIGRTIFQKIAYVATQEGIPTGLHYTKSSFGPFSKQLKPLVTRMTYYNLLNEEKRGRMFRVRVGQTFWDARVAYETELQRWEGIISRVTDLFLRLNSERAEIVATVLFAGREMVPEESATEMDVYEAVLDWKRGRIDEDEVALSIRNLAALRWLNVQGSRDLPLPSEAFI